MAIIESRPFLTPHPDDISVSVTLKQPNVAFDQLAEHWHPGMSVVLSYSATLKPDFWSEAHIPQGELIELVAVAECPAAKYRWESRAAFALENSVWTAHTELHIDGEIVAIEAIAEAWIVGPGRTSYKDHSQVHVGAKLWQSPKPIVLPLTEQDGLFPVSAVSFEATNRPRVPWAVEITEIADHQTPIGSCLRLFINADLKAAYLLAEDQLDDNHMSILQTDIYMAVLTHLHKTSAGIPNRELEVHAEAESQSLGAFGFKIAADLGLQPFEALRLAGEEPLALLQRCKQVLEYLGE